MSGTHYFFVGESAELIAEWFRSHSVPNDFWNVGHSPIWDETGYCRIYLRVTVRGDDLAALFALTWSDSMFHHNI